jgi:hypothetical protein
MGSSGSLCEQSTLVERVRGVIEHLGRSPQERSAAWREPLPRAARAVRRDLDELGARLARYRAAFPDLMPVEEGPLLGMARELYGNDDQTGYAGLPGVLPRE